MRHPDPPARQDWPPRPGDPVEALALLTRLPVGRWHRAPRGAAAAWAWPLAGAIVGGLAGASGWAALALGLPPGAAAALALGVGALLTGALHEDGLADCADGLGGGRDRTHALSIMADSRIGSFGAVALGLTLLLRWSLVASLLAGGAGWGALVAAGAISRWPMALLLWALPPARDGGLARGIGRPGTPTLVLGGALALGLGLLAAGPAAAAAMLAAGLWALIWTWRVRVRLGGQTGDACGAAQQGAEIAVLLVLAARV
ncbi:adenosylcobinamide-GDP ribazoletransferase [Rubellimicrobium sp. CFH 75288]|uniref:adenosylcobinamide-GDP ribazoletransferase n=1 Tax=Rubellimicrobium sp. CFH 75288 TaxID=2697034 RepID=UPI0014133322|nr:adenosylcobinamide-GDP ribazoletransferase [Rubellimicrobium sp. CFH 75288]NAZ35480.1 adenosylcobinamide-GDP ribazoletransferase [Rubellimicrobium sp. CFH 75288]